MANAKQMISIVIKAKDEYSKVAGEVQKGIGNWKGAAVAGGAAMTALGASSGAALKGARNEALAYGREVVNIQRVTGESAEEASKAAAVFNRLGIDQKGAVTIYRKLATSIVGSTEAQEKAAGATAKQAYKVQELEDKLKKADAKHRPRIIAQLEDARAKLGAAKAAEAAAGAFRQMGIATTNADGSLRGTNEVLKDVAEYYKNATNKTEAAALASSVLGRGYAGLLPVLTSGKEGIDKITTAAEKQGMILDDKAIKSVKEYGKAMKDNEQAVKGMEIQMGLLTLPMETFKAEVLAGLLEQLNALPPAWKNAVGGGMMLAELIGKIAGPLLMALPGLSALGVNVAGIGTAISGALGSIGAAFGSIATGIAGATGLAAGALVALAGAVGFGIGTLLNKLEPVKKVQKWLGEQLGKAIYDVGVAFETFDRPGEKAAQMIQKIGKAIYDAGVAFETFDRPGEKAAQMIQKITDKVRSLPREVAALPAKLGRAFTDLLRIIKGPIDAIIAKLKEINPFMRHSPSLVDNVLAGVDVIGSAYASIGDIKIKPPTLATPALATPTAPALYGGGRGMAQQPVVKVYLDGRELNRGMASVASATARSGSR